MREGADTHVYELRPRGESELDRNDLNVTLFLSVVTGATVLVAGAILLAERAFVSSLERQDTLQAAEQVETEDASLASR
jgi:hypothetical protein